MPSFAKRACLPALLSTRERFGTLCAPRRENGGSPPPLFHTIPPIGGTGVWNLLQPCRWNVSFGLHSFPRTENEKVFMVLGAILFGEDCGSSRPLRIFRSCWPAAFDRIRDAGIPEFARVLPFILLVLGIWLTIRWFRGERPRRMAATREGNVPPAISNA